MMIVDCHGHCATAPAARDEFRGQQILYVHEPSLPEPTAGAISEVVRHKVFEGNARRVYPRLDQALKNRGR